MIALLMVVRDIALALAFAWIGVTLEPAHRSDGCRAQACEASPSDAHH
jgi:hypothetical protein